ncbi:MAG: ribosome biogenesis GTPase Der [Alkalispirochaeta sp.]
MIRICIAGRPNVGKSTLFNRIYGRRLAITDRMPGVTRDAVAVEAEIADLPVLLIDTGGIGEGEAQLDRQVYDRSRSEMARADVVLLLVEVGGITGEDEELLELLRRSGKPSILVVNKVDNPQRDQMVSEFWQYGVPRVVGVSAAHGLGMDDLEDEILGILSEAGLYTKRDPGDVAFSEDEGQSEDPLSSAVRLAIIGQPNTGKSRLLNRLVGEERAIVSDLAGTTRDTVEAHFTFRGTDFVVVDTAGIRRRSRVNENVEYYAVQRAYDAIDAAEMVVLMIDAVKGLSEQDKKIAARLTDRGRGTVVVLNKWDLLDDRGNQLNAITDRIHFLFPVFQYVPILPLSAVTGEGVDVLLKRLLHVRRELHRRVDTGPLNQALQRWLTETPPPSGKKPYKVRYITQVGTNPVRFILFVNRRKSFPEFYLRYIRNRIREEMGFEHIPFFVELKE